MSCSGKIDINMSGLVGFLPFTALVAWITGLVMPQYQETAFGIAKISIIVFGILLFFGLCIAIPVWWLWFRKE